MDIQWHGKKKKNLFLLVKEKPIPFHRSIVVLVHQGIEIEVLKVDCAIKNLMTLAQGSFPMGWRKKIIELDMKPRE